MAVVYAVKTGSWSDTTVWNTGSLPTSADDVYANNFTVTINQNINVLSLNSRATTGVNNGGTFSFSSGTYTIVCDTINAGSGTCITINNTGTYTITCTTINGGVSPNSGSGIFMNALSSNLTINGNMQGNGGVAFDSNSANNIVINGNVFGGTGTGVVGVNVRGNLNITVNGFCQGAAASSGLNVGANTAFLIVNVTKAVASNFYGVGIVNNNPLSNVYVKEIEQGTNGIIPIQGYVRLSTASGAFYKGLTTGTSQRTLSDPADIAGQVPAASDVRFGVTYQSGSKTGTAYIPAAGSVALGVPVDNTLGTAALTPQAVWDYATASMTTSGSIGERLKNVSTVDTTGDQIVALL